MQWLSDSVRRTLAAMLVLVALVAASCGGGSDEPDTAAAPTETPAEAPSVEEAPEVAAADDSEQEPAENDDPFAVWTITADPSTGVELGSDPSFREVQLYDAPEGERVFFDMPVINPTWFGTELTLMVVEGDGGDEWVKVQLPIRPNGTEAWVQTDGFTFDSHRFNAKVDLSDYYVEVFDGDELIAQTTAVIGRDAAPTPLGTYFVNDKVQGDNGAYGSWILSLSAFSETLDTFNGGLPVIAIHGTNSPELVGQALSSGCIRVPDDVIQFLAEELPLGTPVEIVA